MRSGKRIVAWIVLVLFAGLLIAMTDVNAAFADQPNPKPKRHHQDGNTQADRLSIRHTKRQDDVPNYRPGPLPMGWQKSESDRDYDSHRKGQGA